MQSSNTTHVMYIISSKYSTYMQPSSTTSNKTLGHAIIERRGLFAEARFYWIGIGALFGFCIIYNVLFTLALAYLNRKSVMLLSCTTIFSIIITVGWEI